jgi:predicted TIM-barrel fold metal-dependent hydrolase
MERQGVEKCILYPAGMALAAEHYVSDTEALYANLRSFNRWYNETWGFNHEDRLYATAVLSLRDIELAVVETERILDEGARVVLVPTGPAYGRSPGEPYFDPVWSRLAEAGVTVAFHIMPFWYFDAISPAWGHNANPASWHMSAWQWNNVYGERPIEDTLSALIFDNLFGRHPKLMVIVSEHGAEWVPHFVRHMDKSRGMGRNGPWKGGKLTERPSEIFRRHVRVAPYPEDDIPWIVENLKQSDSIVMGSDFPHAEGLAEPADFVKLLDGLPEDVQRRILRDNADAVFAGAG